MSEAAEVRRRRASLGCGEAHQTGWDAIRSVKFDTADEGLANSCLLERKILMEAEVLIRSCGYILSKFLRIACP